VIIGVCVCVYSGAGIKIYYKVLIISLTSRVVPTEKDIKESQRKITEVESGIQGVGNLFDNLKTVCEKNRNAVAKTEDQYEVLNVKCNKNKSDIKKLSVDIVNNSNYSRDEPHVSQ
jgi:peptidoglycan hydrolase CwlO-like protein